MRRTPYAVVLAVGFFAFVWIIPLIGLIATSVRPTAETTNGWWRLDQITVTFDAWQKVWTSFPLGQAFITTMQLTLLSVLLTMLMAPAAAYAFHFLRFRGRRWMLVILVNAFVLPQQIVIIPLFTLYRDLQMIDSVWAVIIPQVGLSFAWAVFLVKTFFDDFPRELIDAAKVDNCGPLRTYFYVVLPNSITPITAVGILQFLWCWNSLLLPMLYLRTQVPLTVLLAQIAGSYDANFDQQAVAAIITLSAPLMVFILFQRFFAMGAKNASGSKE